MTSSDNDIKQQLRLGEDSLWEFKQIVFSGNEPKKPRPNELADEIIAFANADGGVLLCGVTDDGNVTGMSVEQMKALDSLLVALCTDSIKPPVRIATRHSEVSGKNLLQVIIPKGDALYERDGRSFIRVGATKRRMNSDEKLRLAQRRTQSRYLWFDEQPLPDTGFSTLDEALWKPLLSAEGGRDPEMGLRRLAVLKNDDSGALRATVAGALLCTKRPDQWLPHATIMATRYKEKDRSSGQMDAQEMTGPLHNQIAEAVAFIIRNMHVAAHKDPARRNLPQYSDKAVFEAIVNAVVHRDYAIRGSRIRLSMFSDRVEIQSPGALPNTLTVESMAERQVTRNQTIASLFSRIPVGEIRGSEEIEFLMERRGDGVPVIRRETHGLTGKLPEYRVIDNSELLLIIPAAPLETSPAQTVITVRSAGQSLPDVDLLALFPNNTWKRTTTDTNGEAVLDLYTTELPMTIFAARAGFAACLEREWVPQQGALALNMHVLNEGGSVIFPEATGHIQGLQGRLNPIRDNLDRTYLYADNIAINSGKQQPVTFVPGEEMRLTDANGVERIIRIIEILGRSALVEYQIPSI